MTDLPFHIDTINRFELSMWKMSSYHRYTLWMRPDGSPTNIDLREFSAGIRAGELVKVHDNVQTEGAPAGLQGREAARANALTMLRRVGYRPGMTAEETRRRLAKQLDHSTAGALMRYGQALGEPADAPAWMQTENEIGRQRLRALLTSFGLNLDLPNFGSEKLPPEQATFAQIVVAVVNHAKAIGRITMTADPAADKQAIEAEFSGLRVALEEYGLDPVKVGLAAAEIVSSTSAKEL